MQFMSFFSPKRAKNVKKTRLNIHFRIKTFVGKEKLYNFLFLETFSHKITDIIVSPFKIVYKNSDTGSEKVIEIWPFVSSISFLFKVSFSEKGIKYFK